ncbi:hypothetical protein, partial [Romboutsia sp.]|uniref:hypothetical protein n=1 Tax=Romboutsia sp. TaxID=1965302 RepID=UPI002CE6E51B
MLTIVNMIDKLLQNYFKPDEIAEYKNIIAKSSEKQKPFKTSLNKATKDQLNSEIAPTQNYHASINFLITFAENKLVKQKFLEFLQSLGELSIAQGELNTATEIYNFILNLINNDPKQENAAAHAILALGDITSRYAEWEKSIS